jgi:hypothetical protein
VNPDVVAALIAGGAFIVTCVVNAAILGFFLGGMKSDMRMMSDRLARIEGMFTLVPRGGVKNEIGQSLSVGVDRMGDVVSAMGISADLLQGRSIHSKRLYLEARGLRSRLDRAPVFYRCVLCLAFLPYGV